MPPGCLQSAPEGTGTSSSPLPKSLLLHLGSLWGEATSKDSRSQAIMNFLQATMEMGCLVPTGTGHSQSCRVNECYGLRGCETRDQLEWRFQSSKWSGKETAREAKRGEIAEITCWEHSQPRAASLGVLRITDGQTPAS